MSHVSCLLKHTWNPSRLARGEDNYPTGKRSQKMLFVGVVRIPKSLGMFLIFLGTNG